MSRGVFSSAVFVVMLTLPGCNSSESRNLSILANRACARHGGVVRIESPETIYSVVICRDGYTEGIGSE